MLQNVLQKPVPLNNRRLPTIPLVRVKFTPDDALVVEWFDALSATLKVDTLAEEVEATLAQLKAQGQLKTAVATVWVPTQAVLLTDVVVPGKRKADWQAALPYMLEESLSQPIEQFHVVVYGRSAANVVSCAVVERKKMQLWQTRLQALGLAHVHLVPDCFALPEPKMTAKAMAKTTAKIKTQALPEQPSLAPLTENNQAWSVYADDSLARSLVANSLVPRSVPHSVRIVRTGTFSGFACDQAWFEQVMSLPHHQAVTLTTIAPSIEPPIQPLSSAAARPLLSLSRGDFKAQSAWHAGVKRLRWVAGLVVLMLATELVATHLQTQRLAAQAGLYQTQTQALFKQLFPDVKRVVNLRAQTTSRLKAVSSTPVTQTPMQMLAKVQPYFAQTPEVSIKKITLLSVKNRPRLSVQVTAAQAAALQKLVALSEADRSLDNAQSIKLTLELKNVTPSSAEGVLYVDAN